MSELTQRRAFGAQLRQERETRQVSAEELADRLSTSPESVRMWEKGKRVPKPARIFEIEQALGVPAGTLSRHLGFVPASGVATSPASLLEAIESAEELDETGRLLLAAAARAVIAAHYRQQTRRRRP
jgi:transcriptional regulator with XRE-family HTH domain